MSRIDPATNKVSARIAVGAGQLGGVAFGDGSIWVANFDGGELDRIDPAANAVVARIAVGGQPVGPTVAGDGTVWVSNFDGSVERIDPATNTVAARIVVGGKAEATAVAFGLVWSTNNDGTIATIDPATNQVVGTPITVDQDVDAIAPAPDGVWVCTYYAGTVAFVDSGGQAGREAADPRRQLLGHRVRGGLRLGEPNAARSDRRRSTRRRRRSTGVIKVGNRPRDIAFGANSLWVVNEGSGTVSRIPLPSGPVPDGGFA